MAKFPIIQSDQALMGRVMSPGVKLPRLGGLDPKGGGFVPASAPLPPGAENRRRPRIGIDELNRLGVAAVKQKWPDLPQRMKGLEAAAPDERPALEKAFDWLDLPRNAVGNIIGAMAGVDTAKLPKGALGLPKVFMSDVLNKLGVENQVARAIIGFAGDVAIDPLTYLVPQGKVGLSIGKCVPTILRGGRNLLRQAAEAMVTKRAIPEAVLKALGITQEGAWRMGAGLAAKRGIQGATNFLWSSKGGFLGRALRNATQHPRLAEGARAFVTQFGQKGTAIAKVPFTEAALTVPWGKPAKLAREFAEGTAGPTFAAISKEATKAREAQTVVKAGKAEAGEKKAVIAVLQRKLSEARKRYDAAVKDWQYGHVAEDVVPPHYKREVVPNAAVRAAQREVRAAEAALGKMQGIPGRKIDLAEKAGPVTAAEGQRKYALREAAPPFAAAALDQIIGQVDEGTGRTLRLLQTKLADLLTQSAHYAQMGAAAIGKPFVTDAEKVARQAGDILADAIAKAVGPALLELAPKTGGKRLFSKARQAVRAAGQMGAKGQADVRDKVIAAATQIVNDARETLGKARRAAPKITTYVPAVAGAKTTERLASMEAAQIPQLTTDIHAAEERVVAGKQAAQEAQQAQRLLRTAPSAPLSMKLAAEEKYGKTYLPATAIAMQTAEKVAQAKGPLGRAAAKIEGSWRQAESLVGRVKQHLFGYGPNELGRELAGANVRGHRWAMVVGTRAAKDIADSMKPAVDALTTQGMSKEEAAQALFHYIDSGIGTGKARFSPDDAIHTFLATDAAKGGAAAEPVTKFVQTVADVLDKMHAGLKERGYELGKLEDYVPYVLTPAANRAATEQGWRIWRPYSPNRVRQYRFRLAPGTELPAGLTVPASHWTDPGREFLVLSSDPDALAKAQDFTKGKNAALKAAGDYDISAMQWNEWRKAKGPGQGAFGGFFHGPTAQQVELSVPKAVGAGAAKAERTHAALDVRDLIARHAFAMDQGEIARNADFSGWVPIQDMLKGHEQSPVYHIFEPLGKQGLAVPQPVAGQLRRFIEVAEDQRELRGVRGALDWYVNKVWKPFTLMSPAYWFRNTAQAFLGAAMGGANVGKVAANSLPTAPIGHAVAEAQKGRGITGTIRVLGRDIPAEDFIRDARKYNLMGTGLAATMLEPGMFNRLKGVYDRFGSSWFEFVQRQEDTVRLAIFHSFLEAGMDAKQAALRTVLAMSDLSDLTKFEQGIRRWIPFFSWMRKNGTAILRLSAERPMLPALPEKARRAVEEALVGDPIDARLRPDWQNEQQAMQVYGDNQRGIVFLLANWLPFQDVMDAFAGAQTPGHFFRALLSKLRPDVKAAIELGTGQDIFKRAAQPQFTTADLLAALPAELAGKGGTPIGNVIGLRPVREIGRIADMPSVGAGVARAAFAGSFQPADAARGLAAKDYETRAALDKLRAQINRAIAASDPDLADNLLRQYMALSQRRQALGMKTPRAVAAGLQEVAQ